MFKCSFLYKIGSESKGIINELVIRLYLIVLSLRSKICIVMCVQVHLSPLFHCGALLLRCKEVSYNKVSYS